MMFYILALLLVVAQAAKFEVKDKSNNTCLLLDIEGTLDLSISPGNNSAKLDFNDAKELPDSNCTLIKLDMTKSAQVWFEFSGEKDQWQVTPMSTFNVSDVFDVNDTEVVQFKAEPLDFEKTKSYLCKAPVPHVFTEQGTPSPKYNFTVTATTENFQIQSFNSSEFTNATECPQDQPTSTSTSTPTTSTGSTASPTTSTTPAEQSVNATCTDNGVTRIRMTGFFELAITYEAKDKQNKTTSLTRYIEVPATIDTANSSCVENATSETLNLGFFGNTWSIEFIIKSSSSSSLSSNKVTEYYVSNVTLNYEYDEHLPNHAAPEGQKVRVSYSDASSKYLQASSKGYYTCKANTTITLSHNNTVVKLFTRELKYKAFNDQGDAEFSGDVSECSADEDTSSVVPIAVGAALAGLVVIVLIAYLIGRKRSRKSGYESV